MLAAWVFVAAGHSSNDKRRASAHRPAPARRSTIRATSRGDSHRGHLSVVKWPAHGQAALEVGDGEPQASPHQQPVPIASVAKVMTAYLVLERYPLSGTQSGFTVMVTAADARAETQDAAEDQSVAAVAAGERLTERQMLEALLLPSGNNIALMLAVEVAGSKTRFVAEMNAEARMLGMRQTTYTGPSGWDQGTVSTAADQLRLFHQAMRFAVFRQIVAMPSATLPVAGTVTNTNPVIADGYYGKTGSDSAAGACLAFFTHATVDGRGQTVVGVVLGQWQPGSTSVVLAAAGWAAEELVDSVASPSGVTTVAAPGTVGGQGEDRAGRRRLSPLSARPDGALSATRTLLDADGSVGIDTGPARAGDYLAQARLP